MTDELEENILACIALKPDLINELLISEDYFLNNTNKLLLKVFKKQFEDYKTIDISGIAENYKYMFKVNDEINTVIKKYTEIITNNFVTVNNFTYYQETIFKRRIDNGILTDIKAFENSKISQETLLENIYKLGSLQLKTNSNQLTSDEIFRIVNSKNKNINFRFNSLSKYANIQEHDFVVVAARPGIGKTGFILNLLEDISDKYNCILFNMEMSETQCYRRLVGINSKIPIIYHDNPETDYQNEQIKASCKKIASKRIKIISGGQSIRTIRHRIIKESALEHTIVFIDYVGLIASIEKNQSIYERVTSIVKDLRQITLDYNCTIFLVSQINRNSEKEKDKRPKISDLKESGELEQSATTVLMLHNENYYKDVKMKIEDIQLIIGKNRNGQTGILHLNYDPNNQRFDEVNKQYNSPGSWRKEQ